MDTTRWSIACFFVILFVRLSASYKRWLPDTNFDNPDNWNPKRVPCGNDVTIIPDDSPVIYVQLNTTIKQLLLPKNGELILGQNMVLGFTESPVAGCEDVSGDLAFAALSPKPWLDPQNWCMSPTERGACDRSQPTLDVEKLPCQYDDVIFPRDHSYFVDLSEDTPALTVKTLKISGTLFTTYSFSGYMRSPEGEKMFRLSAAGLITDRINITRRSCEAPGGCACGNDRPQISAAICAHVVPFCGRARCSQPVQPVGACCKMCGAALNITRGQGFNFNSFVSDMKSRFLSDEAYEGINATFSLTSEGWVQLVLTDIKGEKSSALAKLILAELRNDIANGGHNFAIQAANPFRAPDTPDASHSPQTVVTMTAGSITGLVLGIIAVIIVIIIIVVIFIFRRRGREFHVPKMPKINLPTMANLPRFPRWGPRARAGPPSGGFSQPRTAPHVDPGFANPLYDTSPFDDGNANMKELELVVSSMEEQPTFDVSEGGFHNPLYGSARPYMFSDPTTAEEPRDDAASSRKGGDATSSS